MPSPEPDELLDIELFRDLTPEERTAVARWFEVEEASAGRNLTHELADGYVFYVLRDGTADVTVDGNQVRTLGAGDYFGEISLLSDDWHQTATVTLTSPAVVWRMFGTNFRLLQANEPRVAGIIAETARRRRAADAAG